MLFGQLNEIIKFKSQKSKFWWQSVVEARTQSKFKSQSQSQS